MKNNWKRNTALFISSQIISLFGTSLVQFAITWYITYKTQSGIMMTISIIAGFLPTFFLSPFAGVWADRYNRKKLIIIADSSIAVATFILAIVFSAGYDAIWLIFVASVIRALGTAVQTPAVSAMLPQMVPEDKLMKVNGLMTSAQSLVTLVSPMVSGALLGFASFQVILLIDVVTALIAVMIFLTLKIDVHKKAKEKQVSGYFDDIKLGLSYIVKHKFIRVFLIFTAIYFVLISPAAFLTPLQVSRTFGNDYWRMTAIEVIFSIGAVGGGILISIWGGFKNRIYTMVAASIGFGLFTMALGLPINFWVYLGFMVILGLIMPSFGTVTSVLFQEKVEENYLGRVFGVLTMITSSMCPLSMLIFGPLADVISIEVILIITGVITIALGLIMGLNKNLVKEGVKSQPIQDKTENKVAETTVI